MIDLGAFFAFGFSAEHVPFLTPAYYLILLFVIPLILLMYPYVTL